MSVADTLRKTQPLYEHIRAQLDPFADLNAHMLHVHLVEADQNSKSHQTQLMSDNKSRTFEGGSSKSRLRVCTIAYVGLSPTVNWPEFYPDRSRVRTRDDLSKIQPLYGESSDYGVSCKKSATCLNTHLIQMQFTVGKHYRKCSAYEPNGISCKRPKLINLDRWKCNYTTHGDDLMAPYSPALHAGCHHSPQLSLHRVV